MATTTTTTITVTTATTRAAINVQAVMIAIQTVIREVQQQLNCSDYPTAPRLQTMVHVGHTQESFISMWSGRTWVKCLLRDECQHKKIYIYIFIYSGRNQEMKCITIQAPRRTWERSYGPCCVKPLPLNQHGDRNLSNLKLWGSQLN